MPTPDRRWLLLWLLLAAAVIGRATARKPHKGVILDHVEFGRRLLVGEELYGPWTTDPDDAPKALHPPYPPSYGFMTMPFAVVDMALGTRAARFVWATLQVLMIGVVFFVLRRLPTGRTGTGPPGTRAPPILGDDPRARWIWLLTLLITARFLLRDMHGGGGNSINIGLCLLSFYCAERGQTKRSGWLLGFSLATKPTQLWLLAVFFLLGHRRVVGHAIVAGITLVAASIAVLRFDLSPWLRWVEGTWALGTQRDTFAVPPLEFPPFIWMNQSLRCALARWTGDVPAHYAAMVPGGITTGLGWPLAVVVWIQRLASLTIVLGLLISAYRLRANTTAARTWLVAATLCASLLLSPLSWKAHHTALIPAVFLLARKAWLERSRASTRFLAAFFVCCGIGGELLGDDFAERVNSLYIVTAFDVGILVIALYAARPRVNESPPPTARC